MGAEDPEAETEVTRKKKYCKEMVFQFKIFLLLQVPLQLQQQQQQQQQQHPSPAVRQKKSGSSSSTKVSNVNGGGGGQRRRRLHRIANSDQVCPCSLCGKSCRSAVFLKRTSLSLSCLSILKHVQEVN